nr:M15 family metallopeptidase [uncultured Azospirillum sp.]
MAIITADSPLIGSVRSTARLNIRRGAPSTTAPVAAKVDVGTLLSVHGIVVGEMVSGNPRWYVGQDGTYFWSGACSDLQAGPPPSPSTAPGSTAGPSSVHRRPDGTIRPLSDAEIKTVFGSFSYSERGKGRINPDPAWVDQNITTMDSPILSEEGFPKIEVHLKAVKPFERVFAAIALAGLANVIRSCAGTYVPRHKGWDPARTLSSHSWGIAIDLNTEWNGYGAVPAPAGTPGSVRELVSIFEAEGFAWGGYFQPQSICDGMHFELARFDLGPIPTS